MGPPRTVIEPPVDRRRSSEAYSEFVGRLGPRLLGTLVLLCGDREVAQELYQEVLLKGWQRWSAVSRMEHPEAWFFTVARNSAASNRRRQNAERRARARLEQQPTAHVDKASALALHSALARLTPQQRELIVLHYFADLSIEDASRMTSLTTAATKSQLMRARQTLRRLLHD